MFNCLQVADIINIDRRSDIISAISYHEGSVRPRPLAAVPDGLEISWS